jgi:hypothetical protein
VASAHILPTLQKVSGRLWDEIQTRQVIPAQCLLGFRPSGDVDLLTVDQLINSRIAKVQHCPVAPIT